MAHIALKQNDELNPETLAAVQQIEASGGDSSTMRGLANSQALFDNYFKFYLPARAGRSVSEELIELVRLKIARHNDCFT